MTHPLTGFLATIGVLLLALVGGVAAQENLPFGPSNYEHDFQLFAPFQLDLDNMSEDQWSGYFFEYNKLYWSYSGERVTVGSPDVVAFAEIIYRVNPGDDFDPLNPPPDPPQIFNTLEDVPPKAGFAFGDRYEIGYQDQGHGWLLGILDGPELHQTEFHGFERVDTNGDGIPDGLPPFIEPDYTDGSDIGPGTGPVGEARAFGFGSVPVLFETPPGYLQGFRDYLTNVVGAEGGTVGGPFLYIGNYGMTVFVEPLTIDEGATFRRADDLDEDGIWGAVAIVDEDDNIIGFITDFDDLHTFNIYFDNVLIQNRTETSGIEAMWTHHLTNQHYMAKHQNNRVSVNWGARFLKLYDQFRVDAEGSILHGGFWDTSFTNSIVGPQIGLQWVVQRQRWRVSTDGRFMFGYNIADWDQVGLVGVGLVPGALNQPLFARPTAFSHGLREQEFSPVAELRVQASYHIFEKAALKFGYTGAFVGNIRRAAPSVRYALPDMGFVDTDGEELLINGFDFGVEFVY